MRAERPEFSKRLVGPTWGYFNTAPGPEGCGAQSIDPNSPAPRKLYSIGQWTAVAGTETRRSSSGIQALRDLP